MFLKSLPQVPLTIRQWFALLVVACILPATIATTLLIYSSYKRERAVVERATLDIARALMQSIDRELSNAQGALQALGASPYLTTGDLAAFYLQAMEVVSYRPGHNLVLSNPSGMQLVNTLEPFGGPLPMHGNPRQIRLVVEIGQPMVSDLYLGLVPQRLLTSVDVPVKRGGAVKYVLSMQFFSERLGKILTEQRIPEGRVVAILDSSGVVVARTREAEHFIGQPATPGVLRMISREAEGSFEDHTLEGIPAVAIFSRSSVSRWVTVIGVHQSILTQGLWKSISWLIVGAVLLLALGLGLAKYIGEYIAASIGGLIEPAMALGYDRPVTIPPSHLREAHHVGQALLQASQLLRQRTGERDLAEQAEQKLLEAKREVERSEAFLRGVFDETPDAVFLVARDGRIARANAEVEHLFGYGHDRLGTLTIDDLLFDSQSENGRAVRDRLLAITARQAIGDSAQLQARRADATAFPVDVMASPLHTSQRDLAIVTVRDVTERKRAEEKLNMLNNRLALATRAGGIAVWEWDLVTGELVWDERMYELYKARKEGANGAYEMWRERLYPDDVARAERERDEALAGAREYATEFRIVWPDGQIRVIRANAIVSRDAAGKPLRMTVINIDVTESRQREEAIGVALREKETLLKELYHRVKNNLQVITSLFNLQGRTLPEGPARTALTEGAGRVQAMALVHEKLYQSGNLSSISLDSYIADLCVQLGRAVSAEQRGVTLSAEVAPMEIGLETAVPLGLLMNELISNCLKHAFPDERGGRIVVRLDREGDGLARLTVSDNGVGFPPGINPTYSHTLGLKLVAALSRQLDGRFFLENRGGAWASLVFRLNERKDDAAKILNGE